MAQQLIVEGNDAIVLANLMRLRGVPPPVRYSDPLKFKDEFIKQAGGIDKVLFVLREALDNPELTNIGLIVDANEQGPASRWQAIRSCLAGKIPESLLSGVVLQAEGICIRAETIPTISIWIMPDNVSKGYLEHFVAQLIPSDDALLTYAEGVIDDMTSRELNRFSDAKRQKALLHSWLAWQRRPGLPFGAAFDAGFLDRSAASADAFAHWFQNAFELEAA
ncbi:MAG: hypothetical protein KF852_11970 [Saprospiraceae bacterium]|nr:hypothetical protein [Saprospiraceae bacterium]